MSDFLWPHGLHYTSLLCPPLCSGVCANSCPLCPWCYLTAPVSPPPYPLPLILPSIRVFSNELALPIRWPKCWSFSISPSNEYSELISFRIDCLISLPCKGLSGVFSRTIQKHQFFSAQPSLWSNSHICTWLLEKHSFYYKDLCQQSGVSAF